MSATWSRSSRATYQRVPTSRSGVLSLEWGPLSTSTNSFTRPVAAVQVLGDRIALYLDPRPGLVARSRPVR